MYQWIALLILSLPQSEKPQDELTPAEIFEKSVKAQLGGRSEILVEDFKLEFNLLVNEADKKIEFRANHSFKKPDRVKTNLDDPDYKVNIFTGFDGRNYWLFDKSRGKVALTGKEHQKDIVEIEERIRLSKILAKTFSIKRFMQDLKDPKRLADATTAEGKRLVVQAKATDFILIKTPLPDTSEIELILYFDASTYLLREIFATPPAPKKLLPGEGAPNMLERSEKFVLSEHKQIKEALIPSSVKIYVGKTIKKPVYDITIGKFDYNMGLKDEDFQAPTK